MSQLRHLAALALLAGAAHRAAAQRRDPARVVDSIFAQWNKPGSPGCAVGVIQNGKWTYQGSYGFANLATGTPITPDTRFYLASVSKQFAAASVALAAQQGKLKLDDPVRKWIPELPAYANGITVRNLVHHTSGVRDYLTLLGLNGRIGDVHSDSAVLRLIASQRALDFTPGSEYSYSNSGYFLLSQVVKRATGLSLRDYAAKNIFEPLGMKHTYFYDDHTQRHPEKGPMAMGYNSKGDGKYDQGLYPNFEQVGDGGLYSTLNDLILWDQNFYQPKVGDQAFLKLIQTPGKLTTGKPMEYAFALMIRKYAGLETVVHSGGFMGYRTIIQRFPQQRFSAVMLCNEGDISPEVLALRIADTYLADDIDRAQAPLAGEYVSDELATTWKVASRGGRLMVVPQQGKESRLMPEGNDEYIYGEGLGPSKVTFQRQNGRVTGLTVDAGRARAIRFVKR